MGCCADTLGKTYARDSLVWDYGYQDSYAIGGFPLDSDNLSGSQGACLPNWCVVSPVLHGYSTRSKNHFRAPSTHFDIGCSSQTYKPLWVRALGATKARSIRLSLRSHRCLNEGHQGGIQTKKASNLQTNNRALHRLRLWSFSEHASLLSPSASYSMGLIHLTSLLWWKRNKSKSRRFLLLWARDLPVLFRWRLHFVSSDELNKLEVAVYSQVL